MRIRPWVRNSENTLFVQRKSFQHKHTEKLRFVLTFQNNSHLKGKVLLFEFGYYTNFPLWSILAFLKICELIYLQNKFFLQCGILNAAACRCNPYFYYIISSPAFRNSYDSFICTRVSFFPFFLFSFFPFFLFSCSNSVRKLFCIKCRKRLGRSN